MTLSAFFLVGPTASGKSSVAEALARENGSELLSVDSMQVYQGLDVGTAKTPVVDRDDLLYHGLDVVELLMRYSVWQYREMAIQAVSAAMQRGNKVIAVGGSGFYVRALIDGLTATPASDPAHQRHWLAIYESKGISSLQDELKSRDLAAYEALENPENPRRLIRALELAEKGASGPGKTWKQGDDRPMLTGIRMEPELLRARIRERVEKMYACGLIAEVEALLERGLRDAPTAAQALGYSEAIACIDGELAIDDAIEKTAGRTWQLARRQMTWFRHQARVDWIDVDSTSDILDVANRVKESWRTHGSVQLPE